MRPVSELSAPTALALPAPVARRLNWGCGDHVREGWVNSDIKPGPLVDVVADITEGLPFESGGIEFAVSVHALPELPLGALVPALVELRRVLKPGGVLRLVLPDLRRAIDAYLAGDDGYFRLVADDSSTLGGRLITQMLWHGYSRSLFTPDFTAELLERAGFEDVVLCVAHETASRFPEIVDLDNREQESFYMEATKPGGPRRNGSRGLDRGGASSWQVLDVRVTRDGDGDGLKGAHLDGPVPGVRAERGPLRIVGWALGERAPAREVEVVSGATVVAGSPIEVKRPGVAERFGDIPGAEAAGFDLKLAPSGRGISELVVRAVLEDGSRAPFAAIRVNVTRHGVRPPTSG